MKHSVSFRILAEGYCKAIENAKRLIEDGKILMRHERFLGAINSFRLAIEEISKAHLLNQPVDYGGQDDKRWEWLWKAFRNNWEKESIILWEFHRDKFEDGNEFDDMVRFMVETRNDSIYVKYDSKNNKFLSPEESIGLFGDLQKFAEEEFRYALILLRMFTIAGELNAAKIENIFVMQHDGERNKTN